MFAFVTRDGYKIAICYRQTQTKTKFEGPHYWVVSTQAFTALWDIKIDQIKNETKKLY